MTHPNNGPDKPATADSTAPRRHRFRPALLAVTERLPHEPAVLPCTTCALG